MKKLVSLFLWFCAATVVAQGCILLLSYLRGNLDKDSIVQVMAIVNGIDVQAEKVRQVLVNAKGTPQPSLEEIREQRALESAELDAREDALRRQKEQLDSQQRELQVQLDRFDQRRAEFEQRLNSLSTGTEEEGIKGVQSYLQELAPDAAKSQILAMLAKGRTEDVVTILKGLNPAKRKKILGEFAAGEEMEKLADILNEVFSAVGLRRLSMLLEMNHRIQAINRVTRLVTHQRQR